MNLSELIPSLPTEGLPHALREQRWHVDHGSIERFPSFLRPAADGAISGIEKLGSWRHFDIGYVDSRRKYHQLPGAGHSARAYYDMGALVRSTSIEEASPETFLWLDEWAELLGVSRNDLRLNSWAVRGANGIDWHFDPEDVIHFQIKGDKLMKFLPSEATRAADTHAKRLEKFLKPAQDFSRASEVIVREGTITIIPRGVWHWSEGRNDESFAVALCVNPPSVATMLTQALYRQLRVLESERRPVYGTVAEQRALLDEGLRALKNLVDRLDGDAVLTCDRRRDFEPARVDGAYFQASPAARAELSPLRLWINDRELRVDGEESHLAVLRVICENARGFRGAEIGRLAPEAAPELRREVLASLVNVGFLEAAL